MKNPTRITWVDPTQYEDGTPFTAPDFVAYELGRSSSPTVDPTEVLLVLPVALGVGQSPIPDAVRATRGLQYIFLRTRDVDDEVSVWSSPGAEVQFTRRPLAPTSVDSSIG